MARVVVLGSSNTDLTVRLPRLPTPGETRLGGVFFTGPGGKGANQAVAARRAGAEVVFITAVGDDAFGRESLIHYEREGLDLSHVKVVAGEPSGVALIFVGEEGENMIGVASGANARLDPEDIDRLPDTLFPSAGVLLVGLEVPIETVARAVRRASAAGTIVILNPAPAAEAVMEGEVLADVHVLTPNRGEAGLLAGTATDDLDGVLQSAQSLRRRGARSVVVTLGAEGCLVVSGDEARRIPSPRVVAVDTVGAGDAFNGALAVALAEGRSLFEAAAWATAAAALAVTRHGAQGALPRREAIDRLARDLHLI